MCVKTLMELKFVLKKKPQRQLPYDWDNLYPSSAQMLPNDNVYQGNCFPILTSCICQHSGPAFRHLTPLLLLRTTSNHVFPESGFWCGSLARCRVIDKKEDMGNIKAEMHSFELLATL